MEFSNSELLLNKCQNKALVSQRAPFHSFIFHRYAFCAGRTYPHICAHAHLRPDLTAHCLALLDVIDISLTVQT